MRTQRPYIFFAKITLLTLIISVFPLPEIVLNIAPFWVLLFFTYWLTCFTITQGRFFIALALGVINLVEKILFSDAVLLILSIIFHQCLHFESANFTL
jgi:rod shape-determining protein MreD